MIKAVATGPNGRKIVLLGISNENVKRMNEGKPLHIHGEEMGLGNLEIWIITGKDEAALTKTFAPIIGPETMVSDQTKDRHQ